MPEQAAAVWQVAVDREICMGTGMCIVYAPGTFSHDHETKAVASRPIGDDPAAVRAAVESCPTGALALVTEQREV